MRAFDFYSPTYFVFGKERETETGRYVFVSQLFQYLFF